jgi:hypothetical protein
VGGVGRLRFVDVDGAGRYFAEQSPRRLGPTRIDHHPLRHIGQEADADQRAIDTGLLQEAGDAVAVQQPWMISACGRSGA